MNQKIRQKIRMARAIAKKHFPRFGWKMTRTAILTLVAASAFAAYASFVEPTAPPSGSTQDFAQNILGADNSHNAFNSSAVTANATGSIIERLQYIQGLSSLPAESVVKSGTAYGNQNNGSLTPASGATSGLTATASDVRSGKIYFGADTSGWTSGTGTLTMPTQNEYNGSGSGTNDTPYTQALGGVDDYNNNSTMPSDTYAVTWTTCNSGNNYCGTGDATNANKKDTDTDLTWSNWLDSGNSHDWFWANNCAEPGSGSNPGTCASNGDAACQCVKLTSSKTGCEALGGGWRLPYQKELMQSYIDGSWGNLSSANSNYWSSTTNSNSTQYAWGVNQNNGSTNSNNKTSTNKVRCVR